MQNYQKLVKTKKKFRKIKLETLQNVVFAFFFYLFTCVFHAGSCSISQW